MPLFVAFVGLMMVSMVVISCASGTGTKKTRPNGKSDIYFAGAVVGGAVGDCSGGGCGGGGGGCGGGGGGGCGGGC
ncbi:hypothetical protein SUGI_1127090 [Cryptomeria japonica]|nr:hypothetical protein SUGI_1127090 [Cryptomeria japonica]